MNVIACGEHVSLRYLFPSDVDRYVRWQTHGEWRVYDAPWEGVHTNLTKEKEARIRMQFLERYTYDQSSPPRRAMIATKGGKALGWVNRYVNERFQDAWFVGINICEDEYLDRGFGTEALGLWIDYLFSNSCSHRIGLDTWSFNERMMRVAEKPGFVYEGAQRELIKWQGEWLDGVHFGMLRGEWEEMRIIRASARRQNVRTSRASN